MKRTTWIIFAALCILSASAWIVPADSSPLPSLEKQGLVFAAIGLVALLISGPRILQRNRWSSSTNLILASILFFGIPALAIELASGSVPQTTRSALFALVPVVVIIAITAGNAKEPGEEGVRRLLPSALIGLGGLLLLLPLDFSSTLRGAGMLVILITAVILAGLAGVRLFRTLRNFKLSDAVALSCLSTATFLLIACTLIGGSVWTINSLESLASLSSLVDLIEVLLLLWLLRELSPIPFASRYLMIPLLTVIEGYLLVRPAPTLRMGTGVILLAIGAVSLLIPRPSSEDQMLSLL